MVVVVCDIEIWSIEKRFSSEVVRISYFEQNVTICNKCDHFTLTVFNYELGHSPLIVSALR